MRVSVKWLKELVSSKKTPQELADLFVSRGIGVENILRIGERLENKVVGEIIDITSDQITVSNGKDNFNITYPSFGLKIRDKVAFDLNTRQVVKKSEIGLEGSEPITLPQEVNCGEKVLLYLDDYILDFEIAPNRGDLTGLIGIARELACYEEKELSLPKFEFLEGANPITDSFGLEVIDKQGCPDYIARLITGVKIEPSPFWLQWRIHACGLRPVNNVVDSSNYILFKYGQPLHTFDFEKLVGKKIIVRRAQKTEKIKTIDGVERNLGEAVLMIADQNRTVAIAGIMGGIDTEISIATKNVLLECARFDPIVIRKGAQHLKLSTEASRRFEMGIDPNNLEIASSETAAMIASLAQGKIAQGKVESRTPIAENMTKLQPQQVNKLLGIKISKKKTKQILQSLGFGIQAENKFWQVKIPSFRPDVQRDADLIEEIGRVHGYGNLPSRFQLGGKEPGHRDKTSQNLDRIREIMNGGGFNEIYTVSFTDETNAQMFYSKGLITIPSPLNERYSVLRPMLLPTMLEVVNLNLRKGNKDLRLFEIGKVYFDNQGPQESTVLGGIMTGEKFPIHWETKSALINYFDLKAVLETLFMEWQLKEVNFIATTEKFLKPQDATAVRIGDIEFGFLGTLNKEINQRYEFSQEVYVFELNLEKIGQLMTGLKRFESLPRFPGVVRDFAFVLDQKITVAEIERRIWQAGGEQLESVKVFDCFSGGPLATGKKNLGIRLVLRARDRTLLEEEANRIFARIVEKLKSEFKVNLRGE